MSTRIAAGLLCCVGALAPLAVAAQTRLPTIPPDQYTAEQKQAAAEFLAARKLPVFGPFQPLMHSPVLMSDARAMGDYLRYHSAIGNRLSELVILVVAREWSQDYEWSVHAPTARQQGIAAEIIAAIADGRRPDGMSEDETICYDFSIELNRYRRVSDATYARALKRFGDKGVVDIIGLNGYYTLLAMALNTARTPPAAGAPSLQRFPE